MAMAITMDQIQTETQTAAPATTAGLPFSFHGRAGEYFGIWIVNLLLSIITLGIYSAWAKVRTKRYFYGNTKLDGSAFDYLASPIQILKGRLIMFAFFLAYAVISTIWPIAVLPFIIAIFLLAPWAIVRARAFNAHNSSYRNVRFSYKGKLAEAFQLFVLWPIATLLTLGGLAPYVARRVDRFLMNDASYGKAPVAFDGKTSVYYRIYAIALLLAWPALLLYGGMVAFGIFMSMKTIGLDPVEAEQASAEAMLQIQIWLAPFVHWLPILLLIAIPLAIVAWTYLTVARQNYLFNNTKVGPHELRLNLSLARVLWIRFSNLVVIALSFGLMIPWAQIRMARYQIEQMSLLPRGDLDTLVGEQRNKVGAYGDEMGEGMDLDMGLGV
jgi:uncharacterized membrane protein YjgN (DUF898 family)